MAVDPNNVDYTSVEDVTDIRPRPTIAVSETEHHFGSIGAEGKLLLKELLQATSEDEPFDERVFGRLGVGFSHSRWEDFDLYWADDEGQLVEALEEWNGMRSM